MANLNEEDRKKILKELLKILKEAAGPTSFKEQVIKYLKEDKKPYLEVLTYSETLPKYRLILLEHASLMPNGIINISQVTAFGNSESGDGNGLIVIELLSRGIREVYAI